MTRAVNLAYVMHNLDITIPIEQEFADVCEKVREHSGIDSYRLRQLWQAVGQSAKLPEGELLEVGTYKGGSALLIQGAKDYFRLASQFSTCDTFSGFVKASSETDIWKDGEMKFSEVEKVRKLLPKVNVLAGIFPDETGHLIANRTFRFAHIDVDIYQSAKDIWKWLWPRLVPGGLIVMDDVEIGDTPGITQLVGELERMPGAYWFRNNMGQALVVKL